MTIPESRLEEIRQQAVHPQIAGRDPYYDLPALKPPVWTWEVPLYFFIGGISGVSSCLAAAGQLFHAQQSMIRLLLWIALVGAAVCPVLLIADLGRPTRFLNMLRVFKWRSAMSMGAWILVLFSGAAATAVLVEELSLQGFDNPGVTFLRWAAGIGSVIFGLLLASYTAVLIGATAIPVWFKNREVLPIHFLTSGLGGAAGILELCGYLIPATQTLGFVAAGIETLLEAYFLLRKRPENKPMHEGTLGSIFLASGILEGPAALLLRAIAGHTPAGRMAAALTFLIGALMSRYCWVRVGVASARDSRALFELQRRGEGKP